MLSSLLYYNIILLSIIINFIFSNNILFNGDLIAKVADFGLALPLIQVGSTHIITETSILLKNRGYTSPEYVDGKVGTFSDVYSYGVVS